MIQNLLFDLGGVIMDIRKENCVEALKAIGFDKAGEYLGEFAQKGPFGQLEQGLISPAEFRDFVRGQIPTPVTDEQIDRAFNRFLVGIPVERLRQLQQLRRVYRIYMLSNTNPIMWDQFIEQAFKADGLTREAYFDGIVTSFRAKVMKPDPAIFRYCVDKLGIKPEETLFLDDSLTNLKAAEALGYRTAHVPAGHEYYKVLQDMNLC